MKLPVKFYLKLAISFWGVASFSVGLMGQTPLTATASVDTDSLLVKEAEQLEERALLWRDAQAYDQAFADLGLAADIYARAQRWKDAVRVLTSQFRYARRIESAEAPESVAVRSLSLLRKHSLHDQDFAGKVYLQRGQAFMIAKQVDSSNLYYLLS